MHAPTVNNPTILFGVTSSHSLKLLGKIPSEMAATGWKVHVVAGDTESEVPEDLRGTKLHTLSMVRKPAVLRDISSLFDWILLLHKIKPAIVVIGTPKAALLGIVSSFVLRVPTRIYHLRGLRLETVYWPARVLFYLLEWITANCSTNVLAVSPSLRDQYCRLRLASKEKVRVLGFGSSHGVDINHFHPDRWKSYQPAEPELKRYRDAGVPVLGFVGRFSKDKGSRELLKCCQVLVERGVSYAILLIGPIEGDREAVYELEQLSCHIMTAGNVSDVAPYLSLMDMLLLPTHREGFPNAALEAAASGLPIVTTNVTGAIDSVIDGHTGLIVPARDGPAMANAVMELLSNPRLLRFFGKNARTWAVSHFDSEFVSHNHIEYLGQIAKTS